jgi:hypothetical protein
VGAVGRTGFGMLQGSSVAVQAPATQFSVAIATSSGSAGTVQNVTLTPVGGSWPSTVLTFITNTIAGSFSPTTRTPTPGTATPMISAFTPSGTTLLVGSVSATATGGMTAVAPAPFTVLAAAVGTMNKTITAANPSASAITGQHIFQMVDAAAAGELLPSNGVEVRRVSDNALIPSTVFGMSYRIDGSVEKYELLAMPTESLPAYGTAGFAPTYTVKAVAGNLTQTPTVPDSDFTTGHDFKVSWTPYDGSGLVYWIKMNDIMAGVSKGPPTRNSNPRMRWDDASSNSMQREIQAEAFFSTGNSLATTHGWLSGIIYIRSLGAGSGKFLAEFVPQYANAYAVLTGAGIGGSTAPLMLEGEFSFYDGATRLKSWGGVNDYRTITGIAASAFASNAVALPSDIFTKVSPEQYRDFSTSISGGVNGGPGVRILSQSGSLGTIDPNYTYMLGVDGGTYTPSAPCFSRATRKQVTWDYHAWPANAFQDVGYVCFTAGLTYMVTTAGTTASSGSGPSGYGNAITDGTVVWTCTTAQVSGVTGVVTMYPTIQLIAGATRICADNDGRPLRIGFTGTILMSGHDRTHLFTKSWLTQPYPVGVSGSDIPDNTVEPNYSLDTFEYFDDLNRQGDNPGDERIGYVNNMAAQGFMNPTNIVSYKKTMIRAIEFAGYPNTLKDARSMATVVPFSGPDYTNSTHWTGLAASNKDFGTVTNAEPLGTPPWPADIIASTVGASFNFRYQATSEASHYPTPAFGAFLRTGRTPFKDMMYNHWIASAACNYGSADVVIGGTTYARAPRGFARTEAWYLKTQNQADQILGDDDPRKALTKRQMTDFGAWLTVVQSTLPADAQKLNFFDDYITSGASSATAIYMSSFYVMSLSMVIGRGTYDGYRQACGSFAFGFWLDLWDERAGGTPFLTGCNEGAHYDNGGNAQGYRFQYPTLTVNTGTSLKYFPDTPSATAWMFNGKGLLPGDFPSTKLINPGSTDANGQLTGNALVNQITWVFDTVDYATVGLFALGTAAQAANQLVARGQTPGPMLARAPRMYSQSFQRFVDFGNGGLEWGKPTGSSGNFGYGSTFNCTYPTFASVPTIAYSPATASVVPGAVTVVLNYVSASAFGIKFDQPTNPGARPAYKIEINANGGGWTTYIAATYAQVVRVECDPAGTRNYQVRVTATNEAGIGSASSAVSATLTTATAGPVVTNGSPTSSSLACTWTQPSGVVSRYFFQWKLSSDSTWTTVPMLLSGNYTLSGLASGTAYDRRVYAVFGVYGDKSLISNTVTSSTS